MLRVFQIEKLVDRLFSLMNNEQCIALVFGGCISNFAETSGLDQGREVQVLGCCGCALEHDTFTP